MASIRLKNSKYEVRLRIDGQSVSKTFDSRQKAEHYALAIELGLDKPNTPKKQTWTLSEALWEYHQQCGCLKKGARQERERIMGLHRQAWVNKDLEDISASDIRDLRDTLLANGRSNSTVRLLMSTISAVYRHANLEWGLDLVNPIAKVKMPSPPKPRNRRLSPNEMGSLMTALGQCRNRFVAPAAQFSLETGLRQGELLGLQWSDISENRTVVHLRDTKNASPRWVPLTERARSILSELPQETQRVFPITRTLLTQAWSHALARAKINDLRWHDLRHEALSRWAHHLRGDVYKLALVSGHKTLQMSMRYVHPVRSEMLALEGTTFTKK